MANVDFPRGFIPIRGCMKTEEYDLHPTTHTAIGKNDLVERRADGYIYRAQASSVTIIGVAAESKAANTGGSLKVYDDPDIVLVAQSDDATDPAAQTDLDLNYNIVDGSPDSRGFSTQEIDGSSKSATATLPIKILRRAKISGGDLSEFGANCAVECIINNHLKKSTGVNG